MLGVDIVVCRACFCAVLFYDPCKITFMSHLNQGLKDRTLISSCKQEEAIWLHPGRHAQVDWVGQRVCFRTVSLNKTWVGNVRWGRSRAWPGLVSAWVWLWSWWHGSRLDHHGSGMHEHAARVLVHFPFSKLYCTTIEDATIVKLKYLGINCNHIQKSKNSVNLTQPKLQIIGVLLSCSH